MLGQSILVVLCAGSTLLPMTVVRPAISQLATPPEVTHFSFWSIKPWFITDGKLATVLIIPPSWDFQRCAISATSLLIILFILVGQDKHKSYELSVIQCEQKGMYERNIFFQNGNQPLPLHRKGAYGLYFFIKMRETYVELFPPCLKIKILYSHSNFN
jgi:hypothetical protein